MCKNNNRFLASAKLYLVTHLHESSRNTRVLVLLKPDISIQPLPAALIPLAILRCLFAMQRVSTLMLQHRATGAIRLWTGRLGEGEGGLGRSDIANFEAELDRTFREEGSIWK